MNNTYEINDGTLAIISTKNGYSKILEDEKSYLLKTSSFDIIDHSCKYFGSSYKGRKEGSKAIMGKSYKLPIVIEDTMNLIFFPTSGVDDEDCIWIAVNKIKEYKEEKFNTTKIIFNNNKEIIVPLSYRAVQNQIFRATRLGHILKNHREINM